MKRPLLLLSLTISASCLFITRSYGQHAKPDTVKVGIYITSIHNIDFKDKEYTVNCWIWLKYKNKAFDFLQNLEVPNAKTVDKSFAVVDSSDNRIFLQMKLQCVMKDSWKISNFPFDRQNLRMSIENSQYDARDLIFVADTVGKNYDPRFTLSGWKIDSCLLSTGIKPYETAFGDETMPPHSDYADFRVRLVITRNASGLFWKMFLGMYLAFLIAYISFYIHVDSMDSRFGLSVGSLFAVVGNKYIIDSSLPESTSFTLVDTLHGLTLFFIFCVITATAYTLKLAKQEKQKQADRFDIVSAQLILLLYIVANIYFISKALHH